MGGWVGGSMDGWIDTYIDREGPSEFMEALKAKATEG